MALSVDIEKRIGRFHLKSRFEAENETLAILGASGCGKSMTLKCIAGIMTPDKGSIVLNGRVLFDSEKKINIPARNRGTGYLFQNYALFPNMTVEQNIACGIPKGRDKVKAVREKVAAFYLEGLERHYPYQLSGGQQQRVALARMLASEPALLMLDEPLSALDSFLKWQLELEILKVQESFDGTILFVSHNRDEVYRLCDRVAVMEDGETIEVLGKKDLYAKPQTLSTALLSGCKNFSAAEKTGPNALFAKDWNAELTSSKPVPDDLKYVGFRAHFFELASAGGRNVLECRVTRVIEDMFSIIVIVRAKGGSDGDWANLRYELDKDKWNKLGNPETLLLRMPEDQLILMR
jgi:molybdate transport system ATP-binding protein